MNRLKDIREARGLTQKQLAERLHTTDVSISRYESEDQRLTLPLMRKLAAELGCSIADIAEERDFTPANNETLPRVITGHGEVEYGNDVYCAIPVYDIRVSAGPGSIVEDGEPEHFSFFRHQWLSTVTNASAKDLAVVRVAGDSMEPTLYHGDHILVDRTVKRAGREGIYVLRIEGDDELRIKRCIRSARTKLLTIKSDNERYPPEHDVPDGSLMVIGRAIWLGRNIGG